MNNKRILCQAITLALSLGSTSVFAAGFQINAQSATGLGQAFAGDGVIADNASVMARNPAAMMLFSRPNFSAGFTVIKTDSRVKEARIDFAKHSNLQADDLSGTSYVPNAYLVMPVNQHWAWGVSAYSNFGTTTQFDDDYLAPGFGGTTSIHSANLGASVAYRLNSQWSFGAGIDVIHGQGKIQRFFRTNKRIPVINVDTKGTGVGFNLGAVYQYNTNNRFGLSYRYSPTIKTKGTVESLGSHADSLEIPLPDMVEFSGYHRINQKFAAVYAVQWVGWSRFDHLNFAGTQKNYAWKDGGHISLGGIYYLNPQWTLRAGYMYDISATDHVKSIAIPDSDRQWFTTGATYHMNTNTSIDLGFAYIMGEDQNFTEKLSETFPIRLHATTRADAMLFGIQYSHNF